LNIFVTGASGYIGGSVAQRLVERKHKVFGLARNDASAKQLQGRGIEPVIGTLADAALLSDAARMSDAVINAAEANDRDPVDTFLRALEGTGKTLIHTSGSGIVGDLANGEPSDRVFDESTPFVPVSLMQGRDSIDRMIVDAARRGVRSVVIRPSLIYGRGRGIRTDSFQIPALISQARRTKVPRYVGRGLNIWSHVHIDDLVDFYSLALERANAGSLYYAEHGEASMSATVASIARMLGLSQPAEGFTIDEAVAEWGPRAHISFASNSRVRANKARRELGWQPHARALFDEIENGGYAS
jgi:nucleoside-diphosphate-sugar epimerase